MIESQDHISEPVNQVEMASEELSFVDRHAIHPLLYAFTSLVFIFLLYQIGGAILMFLVTGAATITRENVWSIRWLTLIGQICFLFLPTLLFARLFAARLSTVFQFRVPGLRESILVFIALFSLQRVFEAYMFFQDQIPIPEALRNLIEPIRNLFEELTKILVHAYSPTELFAVIFIVAVVPAIVEELLFRGLIQKIFERLMSPIVSAILAGTIFGLYHLNPFEVVPLIGLGVFFGLLRYRSQSLLLPMSVHFLNNLLAVLASYYGLNDEHLLTAAQTSLDRPEMLFELIAFTGLFFVSFVAYLRLTHDVSRRI